MTYRIKRRPWFICSAAFKLLSMQLEMDIDGKKKEPMPSPRTHFEELEVYSRRDKEGEPAVAGNIVEEDYGNSDAEKL